MRKHLLFLALAAAMLLPIGAQAQVTLPYSTNFEGDVSEWTLTSGSNGWYVGSATNNGGSKSLYISNDNGVSNAYTIATTSVSWARFQFAAEVGEYGLSFDWKGYGENVNHDYLRVFAVPSDSATYTANVLPDSYTSEYEFLSHIPAGWVEISHRLNLQSAWQTEAATFQIPAAGNYDIVFMWTNDGSVGTQPPAAIDNVHLMQITCPAVYNLRAEQVDQSTATMAWTALGTESSWLVYLNGELQGTATDSTYTFSNLSANTAYTVGVRALCGDGDTALISVTTFRTACGDIALPFAEGFEGMPSGTGTEPLCWQFVKTSTSSSDNHYVSTSSPHSGTQCMYFYPYADQYLISPVMPAGTDPASLEISFFGKISNSGNSRIDAGLMTDTADLTTFRPMFSRSGNGGTWTEYSFYTDTTTLTADEPFYVVFRVYCNNGFGNYIDDVLVSVAGDCRRPASVSVGDITYQSATISWVPETGGSTSAYDVLLNTVNSPNTNAATAIFMDNLTDTSIAISDLAAFTPYYVWVRGNCDGDTTNWRAYGSFTTARSCYPIEQVTLGNVTFNSAYISWQYVGNGRGIDESGVHFILRDSSSIVREWDVLYDEGTGTFITGLNGGTQYTVEMRTVCDPDTATAVVVPFTTASCGTLGDNSTNNNYAPFNRFYNYGYSQMIYPASAAASITGGITGIAFNSIQDRTKIYTVDVYIGETDQTTLTTSTAIPASQLTRVAQGAQMTSHAGFNAIMFDTPYELTGEHANIVVVVDNNTGSYDGSGYTWASHTAPGTTVYYYSDGTNPDPVNLSVSLSALTDKRPDIAFYGECNLDCLAPNLALVSVGETSADLRWARGADESSWAVQYKAAADTAWTDADAATDTLATIDGLSPRTGYTFRVGTNCSDGTILWSNTVSAYTLCSPLVELPYVETFEGMPSGTGTEPLCWQFVKTSTSSSDNHYVSTTSPHAGTQCMYFYPYADQYLISPAMPEGTDPAELEINFWGKINSSGSSRIDVGLMTDPANPASFRQIATFGSNNSVWTEYTTYIDTTSLTSSDIFHVAFRVYASNGYGNYIDDVTIQPASCKRPTGVALTALAYNTATISWHSAAEATYEYYISTTGTVPADSLLTDLGSLEDTVAVVTDLLPNTTYYFWARSICGDVTTGWSSRLSFTTPCAPETTPWSENFDDWSSFSVCWSRYSGLFDTMPTLTTITSGWGTSTTAMGASRHVKVNIYGTSVKYWLVSPSITLGDEGYILNFDAALTAYATSSAPQAVGNDDRFVVAVSTDGMHWSPVYQFGADAARDDEAYTSLNENARTITVPLTAYSGQTIRVAFYGESTVSGGDNDLHIDNLSIESAACMRPINVSVDPGTEDALFSWTDLSTDNNAGYVLVVNTGDSLTGPAALTFNIAAGDTSFTATGLQPATLYYYFLRSACSETVNENSWTTGTFNSECVPLVFPLDDNFDSYLSGSPNFPTCWQRVQSYVSGSTVYPYVYNYNSTRGKVLYMYCSSSSSNRSVVATPLLPAPLNELEISFDYYYSSSFIGVYAATDPNDESTWHLLMNTNTSGSWTTYEFTTDTLSITDTGYIVFASNHSYQSGYLDNVYISQMNPCRRPSSISVVSTSIGPNEGSVTWPAVEGANSYRVKYGTVNNIAMADSIEVTDNTAILTNLQPGTTYYAWVQTLCADGSVSDPRGMATFTTDLNCYPITNLVRTGSNPQAVGYMWTPDSRGTEIQSVDITLLNLADSTTTVFTADGIDYHLFDGLVTDIMYEATLRAVCAVDTATGVTVRFSASNAVNLGEACNEISGNHSTTTDVVPIYDRDRYSLTQTIYPLSSVGEDVTQLTGLAFYNDMPDTHNVKIDVYIGQTSQSSFSGTTPISVANHVQVVSEFSFVSDEAGWVEIPFDMPYTISGTGNIIVTIDNNTGHYTSYDGRKQWAYTSTTTGSAIYVHSDNTNYDPATISSYSFSSSNNIPDVKFFGDCNEVEPNNCYKPVVVVTDVDSVSATLEWAGIGDSYTVQYKQAADTVWTDAVTVTASTATVSGLQPGSYYMLRVVGTCEGGNYESSSISIVTDCAQQHLPYHFGQAELQAASAAGDLTCFDWQNFYRSSSNGNYYVYTYSTGAWFALPEIAEPLSGAQVRLSVAATSSSATSMQVGVMESDGTITWVETVALPHANSSSDVTEQIAYLDSYTGTGNRVVIGSTGSNYMYFHEINVEPLDACRKVSNVAVSDVNETTATVSWTPAAGQTQWIVYLDGQELGMATDSTYQLSGLSGTTEYTVGIRAFCGGTDTARMATATFRTTDHAYTLPYSTGFEAADDNVWAISNTSGSNTWAIGAAAHNSGSQALYISDDNGTSHHYGITSSANSYAYRLFNVATAGDYVVSFDWKAYGESTYDYLRVLLVPGTENITATTPTYSTTGTPAGWIALDYNGTNYKLNLDSTWTSRADTVELTAGNWYLLFFWHNDASGGSQPPAAVDNVSFAAVGNTPGPGPQPGDPCNAPTGLTLVSHDRTTATVSWTAGGSETAWELQLDNGQELVSANATTYTFTDLEPGSDHSVRVRAVCSETSRSGWSAALQFSTLGIADVESALGISLYPNPASSMVAVEANEAVSLNIIDQSGRVVYSSESEATKHSVDVSQMAKGAYYVRLTGQSGTAVRKLVVK